MTETTTEPRIWVSSLSDYNAGRIHGAWIDAAQDSEQLWEEIHEILKTSPEARTCQWCGATYEDGAWSKTCSHAAHFPGNAEEWAIHDYEGFGSYRLSEYESIEDVSKLALAIEEHGEPFVAFLEHASNADDVDELIERFPEEYRGEWDSEEAFAIDRVIELGWSGIPAQVKIPTRTGLDKEVNVFDELSSYIDWETVAREMFQHGACTLVGGHVFEAQW